LTPCQIWTNKQNTSSSAPDQQRSSAPDQRSRTRSAQQLKTAQQIQETAQQRAQIRTAGPDQTTIF